MMESEMLNDLGEKIIVNVWWFKIDFKDIYSNTIFALRC